MTQQHPITPPLELVHQWIHECTGRHYEHHIATQAARWGADQELEECCEYISGAGSWFARPEHRIAELRAARRPKPPSLKELALSELNLTADPDGAELSRTQVDLIRKALEALPDD